MIGRLLDESLVDLRTFDLVASKRRTRKCPEYDVEEAFILVDRQLEEEKQAGKFIGTIQSSSGNKKRKLHDF